MPFRQLISYVSCYLRSGPEYRVFRNSLGGVAAILLASCGPSGCFGPKESQPPLIAAPSPASTASSNNASASAASPSIQPSDTTQNPQKSDLSATEKANSQSSAPAAENKLDGAQRVGTTPQTSTPADLGTPTTQPVGNSGPTSSNPKKRRVTVEIARMIGIPDFPREIDTSSGKINPNTVYGAANLDIQTVTGKTDIALQDRTTEAKLHELMVSSRTGFNDAADIIHLTTLVVEGLDTGNRRVDDATLGVMFEYGTLDQDSTPRQAFAMFETAHRALRDSNDQPLSRDKEMFLTFVHEMSHTFNLHHEDWSGAKMGDSECCFKHGSTIEGYSMTDSVQWHLSQKSLDHFTHSPANYIWPGPQAMPFGYMTREHFSRHQDDPCETFTIIDPANKPTAEDKCDQFVNSPGARISTRAATTGLQLSISFAKQSYEQGEPVFLEVVARNVTDKPIQVPLGLEPEYGNLTITMQGPSNMLPMVYSPPEKIDLRGATMRVLAANEKVTAVARVFAGAQGWTINDVGRYTFQAFLNIPGENKRAVAASDIQTVDIHRTALRNQADSSASRKTAVPRDVRTKEEALFFYLGGASHLESAQNTIEREVDARPDSPATAFARVALARSLLQPTQSFGATARTSVETNDRATRLLCGIGKEVLPVTITSSAFAALRKSATAFHSSKAIDAVASGTAPECAKRSDSSRRAKDVAYEETCDSFQPTAPGNTIYFCTASTSLDGRYNAYLTDLAQRAKAGTVKAILIKGYADVRQMRRPMTNLKLSEMRAETVARYLSANSVGNIVIESFGDRNPLGHGTDPGTLSRNRRVEVVEQPN